MLLTDVNVEYFDEYIERLRIRLGKRDGDQEFTGVQKPTDKIFNNAKRMIGILCNMAGNSANGAVKFAVTYDGKFDIRFSVYDMHLGYIRIEDAGYRCFNGYTNETKFVSCDYSTNDIIEQLKKYMKNYI